MSSYLFGCYPRSCDISIDALEFTHVFSPEKMTESNSYYRPESPDTHEGHSNISDNSEISYILPKTPVFENRQFRRLGPLTSTLVNHELHKPNCKRFVDVCGRQDFMDFPNDLHHTNDCHCVKLRQTQHKGGHFVGKEKRAANIQKVKSSPISPWKGKSSFRRSIARKLKQLRKQRSIKCDATFDC